MAARATVTVRELPARLMRVADAARYLAVKPCTIRAMVQRQELPAVIKPNAPWLLDVRDLDAWVDREKSFL